MSLLTLSTMVSSQDVTFRAKDCGNVRDAFSGKKDAKAHRAARQKYRQYPEQLLPVDSLIQGIQGNVGISDLSHNFLQDLDKMESI